ncbi:eukaryotic translation initiation factor 3 subunit L-like [Limulus polyphemus]|uniref:Eukaryotic translation initiation factor 3 subunit L n=1 Tax=Limulus polyphemus TaxID=6850 RepID=A0ABM1TDM6_LIMPO|nr:eukaryotic translation initiation factor 3 subunit L-like [Limulus polyphemus]
MYAQDDAMFPEYDPYAYPSSHDYDFHTGDPRQDLEYERQFSQSYKVPEGVRNFLVYLRKAIGEGNVYEIQDLYENSYVKLTERYFKTTPWPEVKDVSPIVQDDEIFLILYKELYYHHLYARVQGCLTIDQRFESYYNYCDLFNYILSAEGPVPLELPNQWLWEIIDEFIYQFQSFSHYRSRLSEKSEDEIELLRTSPKIWNVHSVLNVLHSLVDKSNINRQLEVYTSGGDPDSVAGEFGRHPLYKMLGYFSLVGLLRLHSLLGDYYQAIKVLENIELNKKSLYSRVPACQITTYYYVGFAYMMMRRYADAIRTFADILLYVQRTRQMFQHKTAQAEEISKQTDRMYHLLAICLVLHPQLIDESVLSQLKEKHGDKMLRLQKGDLQEFENSFSYSSPKFLSPVPPAYDSIPTNYHKQPFVLQLKVFMDEVQQQLMLPTIRSYLKLYTTMPISKLAAFLDMDEDKFRTHLLCFKVRDMIHIADTKVARRYGDFFIRQIHRFDELYRQIAALQPV